MRFIPRALALVGVAAAIVVGAVSAYASNNANWNVSFSVASATSLVNNTPDVALGAIIPGTVAALPNDDLTITSNDVGGVQLTASAPTSVTESGPAPCTAQNRSASASISLTPTPSSGGSGGLDGTVASIGGNARNGPAPIALTPSAQNVFLTGPTNTGTLTEIFGSILIPGPLGVTSAANSFTTAAGTVPNSNGCSYSFPVSYVLIAQ